MSSARNMNRLMRQMVHKKQERTQTVEEGEPRLADLVEGIPQFRNVRDRGVVQYVRNRDDIYSISMVKEGGTSGTANVSTPETTHATDGWDTLDTGLIIQWGIAEAAADEETVSFPKAFPNACFQVVACGGNVASGTSNVQVDTFTKTTFDVYHASGERPAHWIAIGN